jgi:predicted TIM-barrel fold metal-dependent hydrolase
MIRETVALFTPARCMVASNFPVDRFLGTPLVDLYRTTLDILSFLSLEEKEQVFRRTAEAVYKLKL